MRAAVELEDLLRGETVRLASRLGCHDGTVLPVDPALEPLLPDRGLRRGSTALVAGTGATSLGLTLAARTTREGGWAAVVGVPSLGCVAAHELGVALDRLVVIPFPDRRWPQVAAALTDAFDVVLLRAPNASGADARALGARVRERRCVLVPLGRWPGACDVRLVGREAAWHGLELGHGHLRARSIAVTTDGRGAAARGRTHRLWLPCPDGEVSAVGVRAVS